VQLKNIRDEDFTNYKKCSMVLGFPSCTFKCERDPGGYPGMCQNAALAKARSVEYPVEDLVARYLANPISRAIVCAGLEPFDSWRDLVELVRAFREVTEDDIVIYTGYYPEEVKMVLDELKKFTNIIIKFGRFIPEKEKHYDELLGIELASPNQWAERIS
jgi:hypothetical protein